MRQSKRRMTAKTNAPAAAEMADDDAVPPDMDAFRAMLVRRLNRFIGDRQGTWRDCKEPSCRRARRCKAPQMQCSNVGETPAESPDQIARTKALFYRLLEERMAQIEAERFANSTSSKHNARTR
jgi:hypothetical protein